MLFAGPECPKIYGAWGSARPKPDHIESIQRSPDLVATFKEKSRGKTRWENGKEKGRKNKRCKKGGTG